MNFLKIKPVRQDIEITQHREQVYLNANDKDQFPWLARLNEK